MTTVIIDEDKKKYDDSVREWVDRSFSGIPQEWVQKIADDVYPWPMWGTMWIVDYHGEKLMENSRCMLYDIDELKDEVGQGKNSNYSTDEIEAITKAIAVNDWSVLENYIDEEMAGACCILDKEGNPTAAYIYEIDGRYVLGINGAGWDFYDGVWDKLYDLCGIKWHENK